MDGGAPCNGTTLQVTDYTVIDANGTNPRALADRLSTFSVNEGESSAPVRKTEKDPRQIARKYQTDLCKKALKENLIVYLGTGCGKTHIAVLLIYEMGHLIRKPQNNICIFLAPTVALVEQQARVIQESIDFKVGTYCGCSKRSLGNHDWQKEIDHYEVLVMTPQILLHNLSHCFIKMEQIALLIFDECHYAQVESSHPYAEIMKVFYKTGALKLPRIFGMTASPKMGKGTSINGLETVLHSKVYSVEDKGELERFVTSPKVNVYYYGSDIKDSSCPHELYSRKLEDIKHQCVSMLRKSTDDNNSLNHVKKMLQKVHCSLIFCLASLGVWGALQASNILLKGDNFERSELIEAEENGTDASLCDKYLTQAASLFASGCMKDGNGTDLSSVEALRVPFFSRKLLRLIGVLSNFRLKPNMKCIIFVNRIITVRSLSYILRSLKFLQFWKCDFLLGVHSGLKSMSRKNMNIILEKFRSDQLNLLVATKVGEEGLDIQTCGLVIRFDLPETVSSFIQSRGRARMPQSEYAFLVDSGSQRELNLIEHFKKVELRMNEEIASRTSSTEFVDFELRSYAVDSTGAIISSGQSISLLHHYCSKLPHDEYFNPKPNFYYFDDAKGTVCTIVLPSNAPLHQTVGAPQSSSEEAKKDACLKACKELHELGALNDFLLPDQNNGNEETLEDFSDSDSCDDLDFRRELHEMFVPAVLKEKWTNMDNVFSLNSYFIKFSPDPVDREYKKFAVFLNAPLPGEAEKMKLDLRLALGRCVVTELVPFGVTNFDKDQIVLAEKFQQMFLKAILDRQQFITEFVFLEESDFRESGSSTYYLLLPVIFGKHEETIAVDWMLIQRCLSSPIFRTPDDAIYDNSPYLNNYLQLANGPQSVDDIVSSLVYAPCKDIFFFISDIVADKNGYSSYKDSKSHVQHFIEKFGMHLQYPDQPLLKAKRLFNLNNLLRKKGNTDFQMAESREKEEHFVELPPEICLLKIIGFSKDIGSSLSLLPSIMHRLENLLVAIELKERLSASFPEGEKVTAYRVLEALTTEKCNERFSLERLEVLGDAFLKFAVGRHLFLSHDAFNEGQLTRRRSNIVNNSNLFKLAMKRNLQVYIRDQSFDPTQYFALGRPCSVVCSKEKETSIHSPCRNSMKMGTNAEVRCDKCHQWLYKKTIADVVEALVGAFIVDSGFRAATAFLRWIGIQVEFEESQVSKICSESSIFMSLAAQMDIAVLEKSLGHSFVNKGLLVQAFVHPSYNKHLGGCYQRLEFLGDAVLDYLITSYLYSAYPRLKPGQLTDLRSASVNNISFADVAVSRSFFRFMFCDSTSLFEAMNNYANFIRKSESERQYVESPMCPKALGDLVESCFGAILLDTGFDLKHVWKIMLSFLDPVVSFSRLVRNPFRELLELCQSYGWDLQFTSSKRERQFLVEAKVSGENVSVTAAATNPSKRTAKKITAQHVLAMLKDEGYKKTWSLEKVLKSTCKMEAQLIGYDEKPNIVLAPNATESGILKMKEPSGGDYDVKVYPFSRPTKICNPSLRPRKHSTICNAEEEMAGGISKGSSKSRLYEICIANCWKPPLFECCKEEGPSHLKEFAFKVVVLVEDASDLILECYGEPRLKKKDAADNAAEGAIWYLEQEGYFMG